MKTPPLFLLAVLCAAFAAAQAPSIRASSSQEMQTKVALEGLLENRLETVLRKMLGSEEVFVIANADIATDADRPESEVLPGVMIKKTLSSPAPLELPASLVKRVSLAIYMGRSMSDEDVESARKTAERMIGFKPERGDAVSVERLGAPREAKAPPPSASWLERALEPRNILLLAGLLTAFAALLFVTRKFFEPFLQVLREAVSGLSAARSAPAAEAAARAERTEPDEDRLAAPAPAPAPAAARVDAQGQERKLPFAFVTEKDLPALAMLIPDSADLAAAMVVQYLQPALASKFLGAMSPLRREKVLGYMGKAVLIDQAGVRELEESVLSRIDYIMGGEEKLVSLLDSSSTGLQAEMLATLEQQDPELGQRQFGLGPAVWIERDDFMEDPPKKFFRMAPGREVRLRNAYLVTCTGVDKSADGQITAVRCTVDPATRGGDAPDGRKVKSTIHWVSAKHAVDAEVRMYDRLFTVENPASQHGKDFRIFVNPDSLKVVPAVKAEPSVRELPQGSRFQFERIGYFCVDRDTTSEKLVLNKSRNCCRLGVMSLIIWGF